MQLLCNTILFDRHGQQFTQQIQQCFPWQVALGVSKEDLGSIEPEHATRCHSGRDKSLLELIKIITFGGAGARLRGRDGETFINITERFSPFAVTRYIVQQLSHTAASPSNQLNSPIGK